MKKIYAILTTILIGTVMFAQSPQKLSYQAVIRDGNSILVTSHSVGMRVSILEGTTPVYVETHATTTNANGLVTIEIGGGTFVSGVAFSAIDWSAGTYSIKTETDPTGGTNYTAIVGTSQLLSVPYALYSKTAEGISGTNTGDETTATIKTKLGITTLSGSNTGDQDIAAMVHTNRTALDAVSGINTGDNSTNTQYSSLVTNATHTGDATGATALTVVRINGTSLAGLATGILKNTTSTGVPSIAVAGTDYLTPTGSAALLTGFPTLNQNTTGSAASFTGNLVGEVTGTQGATVVENSAVLGKVLTGYVSGAGTVSETDNILQAIQKLNGNNPAHYIGESYGGGIVFYVYDNGRHGLIAATADQSTGVDWTIGDFQFTVSNAVRDGVNGGLTNTERIIIQAGAGSYAAQLCANYKGGNYADWYLPSKYELNLLYLQRAVVGGLANNNYWSSTEYDIDNAWEQNFISGGQGFYFKAGADYVRAIRAF